MLSPEQLAQYGQDGYVLVSGLIPEETLANAEATMWSVLGMILLHGPLFQKKQMG